MPHVFLSDGAIACLKQVVPLMQKSTELSQHRDALDGLEKELQARKLPCCLFDGHVITGRIIRAPNRIKRNGQFGFFHYNFCSPSCAKTYVETRHNFAPHLLIWFMVYAKRDLGICEDIPSAPAQELIDVYRSDEGVSISDFRRFQDSHRLTERLNHVPINRELWQDEEQVNCTKSFFEVVRDANYLEQRLYQEFKDTGRPIPKAALDAHAVANPEQPADDSEDAVIMHQFQQLYNVNIDGDDNSSEHSAKEDDDTDDLLLEQYAHLRNLKID